MDIVSKKKRSEIMSKIRAKNTKPELLVRKYLFSKGYRYRLHDNKLPGKPDIVLKKYKLAIQVRGCFWHGHKCKLGGLSKTNRSFWKKKINHNKTRDQKNDRKLKHSGYRLLIIRQCDLQKANYKNKIKSYLWK
tara:strand:- start:673 stop:1074 length:402 start_codon:yes stop_codon:yes gene_type:complete